MILPINNLLKVKLTNKSKNIQPKKNEILKMLELCK
jgi:hypothetical protein